MRTLSTSKAGWVPYNEKPKVLSSSEWDGKDQKPTLSDEFDVDDDDQSENKIKSDLWSKIYVFYVIFCYI